MNRAEEAELFNLKTPEISLHDTCNFRHAPAWPYIVDVVPQMLC